VPLFGEPVDFVNGGLYLVRGKHDEAVFSFISIVPIVGDGIGKGAKGVKIIVKASSKVDIAKGIDKGTDVIKGGSEIVEATSPNKLQKLIEKGQAPRGVERVDKPHVPGQKPHVHFEDGTSLNVDGTLHDAHKGTPDPSKKMQKWLEDNGWKVN